MPKTSETPISVHNCFRCDGACYCHGDIDACEVELPEYSYLRCIGCGCKDPEIEGLCKIAKRSDGISDRDNMIGIGAIARSLLERMKP
jgi:hypothetical protein